MRTIRAAIAVAVAALSLTAGASSASAAFAENGVDYGTGIFSTCSPDYQPGVLGQYGASGYYISGCSMRLTCTGTALCRVSERSTITTENFVGHSVTLNTRIRYISSAGAVTGWRDKSCAGTNYCRAEDETYISPGQSASVECNGVRQNAPNRGRVRCQIHLVRSNCAGADTPVASQSQQAAEAAVICLANMERSKAGIAALTENWLLGNAARGHAAAAVARPWWSATADSHTNPYTGTNPQQRIYAAGYCGGTKKVYGFSENTYTASPNPTPRQAVTWWMTHLGPDGTVASNGHRKNILDRNRTELGVGVVLGSADVSRPAQGGTFVQDFGDCINY